MKRSCSVCGSRDNRVIYHQKYILPTSNYFHIGYDVVICCNCGFAFADNIPTQNALENYYREMTKKANMTKRRIALKQRSEEIVQGKLISIMYKNAITNFQKYINKKSRILDVGCYSGGLLSLLRNNGYTNIEGLDMSEFAAKLARKNKIKVNVGSVFDDIGLSKFDLVILTQVLEHIRELPQFIHQLATFMKDDGLLYIDVPDANNFFIADYHNPNYLSDQKEPFLQFSVEHVNFFTSISLSNLMNNNGFEKVFIKSQTTAIAVMASMWRKRAVIKDIWIHNNLNNYIEESQKKIENISSKIDEIIQKKQQIYVWGAGLHTQKLLSITNLEKAKIFAFVDSDEAYQHGKLIDIKIIKPELLKTKKKLPILISSLNFQEEIVSQIKTMKLSNEIITLY